MLGRKRVQDCRCFRDPPPLFFSPPLLFFLVRVRILPNSRKAIRFGRRPRWLFPPPPFSSSPPPSSFVFQGLKFVARRQRKIWRSPNPLPCLPFFLFFFFFPYRDPFTEPGFEGRRTGVLPPPFFSFLLLIPPAIVPCTGNSRVNCNRGGRIVRWCSPPFFFPPPSFFPSVFRICGCEVPLTRRKDS